MIVLPFTFTLDMWNIISLTIIHIVKVNMICIVTLIGWPVDTIVMIVIHGQFWGESGSYYQENNISNLPDN